MSHLAPTLHSGSNQKDTIMDAMQIHRDAAENAVLTSESLASERATNRPLYIMQIVKSSNLGAKDKEHKVAEPFVARKMRMEFRKIILGSTKEHKDAYAAALTDDDFAIVYRGGMGFTVNSPKTIHDILCITQPTFNISVTASTNITYDLAFSKYTGKAIMKAKDKSDRNFGFGEIPPSAFRLVEVNTEDAVRQSFKNALIAGGMQATKIEPRKNAAGGATNEWTIEWTMPPPPIDLFSLHLCYKVPLPSGDEGTISFSGEFCMKHNLHKYCGRPNERWDGKKTCMFCDPNKSKSAGKAKVGKRSFDDMFGDLN